jgi:hypothetical protein
METAKWIIAFVGLLGIGGFLADCVVWETARQHMKNPAWPPHAKFHNGQTILMGIGLGALTFVFLFGSGPPGLRNLLPATGTASLYWISMVLAPMIPGTAWNDPEFRASTPRPLGMHPQQLLAYVVLGLLIVALLFAGQSP